MKITSMLMKLLTKCLDVIYCHKIIKESIKYKGRKANTINIYDDMDNKQNNFK